MIRLDGRVALVTGAGRGLGASHARALAAHGAHVVVHDAGVEADGSGGDPALADAVVAEIEAAGGTAVATYENLETAAGCTRAVETAVERLGRLDVVVQNAGLLVWEELEDADASWERLRRVNVDAPFHLTRAAFPADEAERLRTLRLHDLGPRDVGGRHPARARRLLGRQDGPLRAHARRRRGGRAARDPRQRDLTRGRHTHASP